MRTALPRGAAASGEKAGGSARAVAVGAPAAGRSARSAAVLVPRWLAPSGGGVAVCALGCGVPVMSLGGGGLAALLLGRGVAFRLGWGVAVSMLGRGVVVLRLGRGLAVRVLGRGLGVLALGRGFGGVLLGSGAHAGAAVAPWPPSDASPSESSRSITPELPGHEVPAMPGAAAGTRARAPACALLACAAAEGPSTRAAQDAAAVAAAEAAFRAAVAAGPPCRDVAVRQAACGRGAASLPRPYDEAFELGSSFSALGSARMHMRAQGGRAPPAQGLPRPLPSGQCPRPVHEKPHPDRPDPGPWRDAASSSACRLLWTAWQPRQACRRDSEPARAHAACLRMLAPVPAARLAPPCPPCQAVGCPERPLCPLLQQAPLQPALQPVLLLRRILAAAQPRLPAQPLHTCAQPVPVPRASGVA